MKRIEISTTAQTIPDGFSADLSIVIDVLRASSKIVTALQHGTPEIIPAASVEEAWEHKRKHPDALLAGERDAVKLKGFDQGNSPLECIRNRSAKPIILTTSNGTLALSNVTGSRNIWIACFLNLNAVVHKILKEQPAHVHLACAGTLGHFSMDDFLLAGGLCFHLGSNYQKDDLCLAAEQLYLKAGENIHQFLSSTKHYQTLQSKNFQEDLDFCFQQSLYTIVPMVEKTKDNSLRIKSS